MKRFLALLLLFLPCLVAAQVPGIEPGEAPLPDATDFLENIAADSDAEFDFDTYLLNLEILQRKPLNLNKVTYDDLRDLNLLTDLEVNAIIRYRDLYGPFIAIYELQAVPYLELESIRKILPFVRVREGLEDVSFSPKELLFNGRHQLFVRWGRVLEEQKGYTTAENPGTSRYAGSPDRFYMRYNHNNQNRISYGFTAEKDPGEEFFKGSQKGGFDFWSFHFFLREKKRLKALAIGDYAVNIGQGIAFWTGFGFNKSPEVLMVKKEGRILRPYTSVNEVNFLRGLAATVAFGKFEATAFGSFKAIDGNVIETDTILNEVLVVSSLQLTGLHRTPSELRGRKSIYQAVAGGNLTYRQRSLKLGLSAVQNLLYRSGRPDTINLFINDLFPVRIPNNLRPVEYDRRIYPYNQFQFSGNSLTNLSADYNVIAGNVNFFGEFGMSGNGGFGALNGLIASLDSRVDVSMVHRYFGRNYHTLQTNAFAESSSVSNEHGIFTGIQIRPRRQWTVKGYADIYRHPWLRFATDGPSFGQDYMAEVNHRPNRQTELYLRFRTETKQRNAPDNTTPLDFLEDVKRTSLRFHTSYRVSPSFVFKNRIEAAFTNDYTRNKEKGFIIYHDIQYRPLGSPVSINTRLVLFHTDGFNSRIYAYENDILYFYSIPAYQNKGMRYYIVLKYTPVRGLDFWLRFSQTHYTNRNVISSGLEEIQGNVRSDIRAQIRFSF